MILPWASSTAANSVVMPSRLSSCVRFLSRTRNNGTLLRVRSKTWFWLFSSHHKTNACSGRSRDCPAKFDPFLDEPFETLKAFDLMRFQTGAVSGTRDCILAPPTAHRLRQTVGRPPRGGSCSISARRRQHNRACYTSRHGMPRPRGQRDALVVRQHKDYRNPHGTNPQGLKGLRQSAWRRPIIQRHSLRNRPCFVERC